MLSIEIPGRAAVQLENLVLDFNGTIAQNGVLSPGVPDALKAIAEIGVSVYVITADTNGTASAQCSGLPVQIVISRSENVAEEKRRLVQSLGSGRTISIGNGNNDRLMFEESALSVAVIGEEGCCTKAALASDILVTNILDALSLLLKENHLIATLRG